MEVVGIEYWERRSPEDSYEHTNSSTASVINGNLFILKPIEARVWKYL